MSTFSNINCNEMGKFQSVCYNQSAKSVPFKMAEIKAFTVLEYNRFGLTKLGIYRTTAENETNVFFKAFSSYYIIVLLLAYMTMGSVFIYVHLSDISIALRAVLFIMGGVEAVGMFFFYGINVNMIQIVHTKLQGIVDEIVESKISKQNDK